ncbi:P-loop containing nucleoside triphosphate hydrolase protein [Byssothecium circinans]|uniref:P-loop containing nucleoside triphosphate hydrolase protein n=1 Tax=Byssothecium circinans TaxID=147558 RepID=A0A6A5U4R2_9PLEO|nr:P-loop containing nucleoside triphosphate hydrolase protein [Byssothecium circinans]
MTPKPQFVSVLGPPGSGKGTQCALLKEQYRCEHISVGDLLRSEADDPESPYAAILQENLKHGRIGTKEMTVGIMKRKVDELVKQGEEIILLDGFPRKVETAEYFEKTVGPLQLIIVLVCSDEVLEKRLLERSRADDDMETIRKRITVFKETTVKVAEAYRENGIVVEVNADDELVAVATDILKALERGSVQLGRRQT